MAPHKRKASQSNEEPPRKRSTYGDAKTGLEESLLKISISPQKTKLQKRIEKAMKDTPRFLFRVWSARSGGNAMLNTPDAITPHAFLGMESKPKPLHEMHPHEIARLANMHLTGHIDSKSIFSSWSHSLPFVLAMAVALGGPTDISKHVSILDTSRMNPVNVALHTSAMQRTISDSIGCYNHEFLIYGTLTGDMYQTIKLSALTKFRHRIGAFADRSISQGVTDKMMQAAIVLGGLVEGAYSVAFAAHLLGSRYQGAKHHRDKILEGLATMQIPQSWAGDKSIMTPPSEDYGYTEATRSAHLLRDLVTRQADSLGTEVGTGKEKVVRIAVSAAEEPPRLSVPRRCSIHFSTRVPREVKNLYCDMKGWEDITTPR